MEMVEESMITRDNSCIDEVNKMRIFHAVFQAVDLRVVLKSRNSLWCRKDDRLVVLEVQILCLGGPYQIALLPSLIMPPFSDLSSSHLLRLMLACYSSSHRTLCFQFHFFIRCVASHPNCISTASARIKRLVLLCLGCCEYVFIYKW